MRKNSSQATGKCTRPSGEATGLRPRSWPGSWKGEKVKVHDRAAVHALAAVNAALKGSNMPARRAELRPRAGRRPHREISLTMLKDCGVRIVILGHSERRHAYLESERASSTKGEVGAGPGLRCHPLRGGDGGRAGERASPRRVVKKQVQQGLEGVSAADMGRVVIAYEPVWAIGTGKNATPQDANAVHLFIRQLAAGLYDPEAAERSSSSTAAR